MTSPCPSCGFPRSESKDGSIHCPVCILDSDAVGLDRLLPDLAAEIRAGFQAAQSRAEEAEAEIERIKRIVVEWRDLVELVEEREAERRDTLQQAIQEVEASLEQIAAGNPDCCREAGVPSEGWCAQCVARSALDLLRSKLGRVDG